MTFKAENTESNAVPDNIKREIELFEKLDLSKEEEIKEKFDELIVLLEKSNLDSDLAQLYLQRLENYFKRQSLKSKFEKFEDVVKDDRKSKERMLNEFEFLLASSDINSEDAYRYLRKERHKVILLSILGILFIVLGLGMIIMPAPKYFEMFTIYYFTRDDGITLMDIIASIITVTGLFILISSLKNLKTNY